MPKDLKRCPVGIPGVDEILKGGLLEGRSYLLAGSAGTGKTIFSLQWLIHERNRGKKTLFITLAEPRGDVSDNIQGFGWDLEGVAVADLTPARLGQGSWDEEYHIFPPEEVESLPYWRKVGEAIDQHRPDCMVLDSLTQLRFVSPDDFQFRQKIMLLVALLSERQCTGLLLYEPLEMVRDSSVALAVDGIFRLRKEISQARVVGLRDFQVEKMRGSDFLYGMHPLKIDGQGMHVFPHFIEKTGNLTTPGETLIHSGLTELDEMLGGGIESGTTTLITGPSGVGKSTLSSVFLRNSVVERKERGVYYSFEESRNSLVARCKGLAIPIEELLENQSLKFMRINPMEMYPDQFLHQVRRDVEEEGRVHVVIDSIRGYQLAMEEFGKPVAHLHNLTTYLNRHGVTTYLTIESETITGTMRASELVMSHLADNILVMRYADYLGRVIKVVGCLKKRIGYFAPELRELILKPAPGGISVGPVLSGLRGILAGLPLSETEPVE